MTCEHGYYFPSGCPHCSVAQRLMELPPPMLARLGRPANAIELYDALRAVGGWQARECGCQQLGTGEEYPCERHLAERTEEALLVGAFEFCSHCGASRSVLPDGECRECHFMNVVSKPETCEHAGMVPGALGLGGAMWERFEEQIASAVFRPDRVIIPPEFMTEKMKKATSLEAMADALVDHVRETGAERAQKDLERLAGLDAIDGLGGVVIGPTPEQLDWLLARYLRAQPFTAKALPSRVTVLELMTWLRKEGR